MLRALSTPLNPNHEGVGLQNQQSLDCKRLYMDACESEPLITQQKTAYSPNQQEFPHYPWLLLVGLLNASQMADV